MKRRVYLLGYYGFGNLGDQLLCKYYRELLWEALPSWERVILLANEEAFLPLAGEKGMNRWALHRWLGAIRPGDLWVMGGGTLLQNLTSQRSLAFYLVTMGLAKKRGASLILLGQGLGPVRGGLSRYALAKILRQVSAIEVRDQRSLNLAEDLGAKKIRLGVDPLWRVSLPHPPPRGEDVLLLLRSEDAIYLQVLLKSIEANGLTPRLAVFQASDAEPLRKASGRSITVVSSVSELAAVFANVGVVLSSRMHGLVIAASWGVPGIGWSRDPKINACCESLGLPSYNPSSFNDWKLLILQLKRMMEPGDTHGLEKKVRLLREEAEISREWAIQTLRSF